MSNAVACRPDKAVAAQAHHAFAQVSEDVHVRIAGCKQTLAILLDFLSSGCGWTPRTTGQEAGPNPG